MFDKKIFFYSIGMGIILFLFYLSMKFLLRERFENNFRKENFTDITMHSYNKLTTDSYGTPTLSPFYKVIFTPPINMGNGDPTQLVYYYYLWAGKEPKTKADIPSALNYKGDNHTTSNTPSFEFPSTLLPQGTENISMIIYAQYGTDINWAGDAVFATFPLIGNPVLKSYSLDLPYQPTGATITLNFDPSSIDVGTSTPSVSMSPYRWDYTKNKPSTNPGKSYVFVCPPINASGSTLCTISGTLTDEDLDGNTIYKFTGEVANKVGSSVFTTGTNCGILCTQKTINPSGVINIKIGPYST